MDNFLFGTSNLQIAIVIKFKKCLKYIQDRIETNESNAENHIPDKNRYFVYKRWDMVDRIIKGGVINC